MRVCVYAFDPQTLTRLANKTAQAAARRAKARAKTKGVGGVQKVIKKVRPISYMSLRIVLDAHLCVSRLVGNARPYSSVHGRTKFSTAV
jgi:hypothetical protein